MATVKVTYTDGDDNQIWLKGTGAAGEAWSFSVAGIPAGAVVSGATLTFASGNTYNTPGGTYIYSGTEALAANLLWYVAQSSGGGETRSVDVSSYIKGNGSYSLYFRKTANGSGSQSNVYFSGISVTVTYSIPYTACGAPTSVTVAVTITHDGTTLSWSGATAGSSNAITSYEVQRCESADGSAWGGWSGLETVESTATSGSLAVSPPGTYGSYYKYRVRTRGAAGSAYYSGWKESSNTLRRDHAPLPAWTDTISKGVTLVKAVHLTEMQEAVNTLRTFYGLVEATFGRPQKLADWLERVEEIRTAVDAIGKSHAAWISITVNQPRADVMQQLRDVVNNI